MSREERGDFLRSVEADKELKNLFINTQNTYALTRMIPKKNDNTEGKAAYEQFMQTTRRSITRRIVLRTMAYAASIALLMIGTWHFSRQPEPDTLVRTTEVYVPAGQRTKLTLDDGSVVWLNARSTLVYPSDFSRNRHVTLTGEAFFEVAANPDKPFTVAAKGVNITALGTKFNVSSYPEDDETQVALMEGSVKVWDDSGKELILKPKQQAHYRSNKIATKQELPVDEKLVVKDSRDNKLTLQPIEHEEYFLWTNGVYSFVNEPLSGVFQKLERYYDVKIEITDASVLDNEFTGKFRQQDGVDMILRIIQRIHPFKFERKEDIIIIN